MCRVPSPGEMSLSVCLTDCHGQSGAVHSYQDSPHANTLPSICALSELAGSGRLGTGKMGILEMLNAQL